MQHRKLFIERVANGGGDVYLVHGQCDGEPTWYYLKLDKLKAPLFLEHCKRKTKGVELTRYGKILSSGWGEGPTEEEQRQLQEMLNA